MVESNILEIILSFISAMLIVLIVYMAVIFPHRRCTVCEKFIGFKKAGKKISRGVAYQGDWKEYWCDKCCIDEKNNINKKGCKND